MLRADSVIMVIKTLIRVNPSAGFHLYLHNENCVPANLKKNKKTSMKAITCYNPTRIELTVLVNAN